MNLNRRLTCITAMIRPKVKLSFARRKLTYPECLDGHCRMLELLKINRFVQHRLQTRCGVWTTDPNNTPLSLPRSRCNCTDGIISIKQTSASIRYDGRNSRATPLASTATTTKAVELFASLTITIARRQRTLLLFTHFHHQPSHQTWFLFL